MGMTSGRYIALVLGAFVGVAIMACDAPIDRGVTSVGVMDNELFAQVIKAGPITDFDYFKSEDGGFTWLYVDDISHGNLTSALSGTPLGDFRISGSEVLLETQSQEPEVFYSASHLLQESNRWLQVWKTRHLQETRILAAGPQSITYDWEHNNLVVALGLQGIVIVRPDGSQISAAVGPYRPAEFSKFERVKTLLISYPVWISALALSLSLVAVTSAISSPFKGNRPYERTLEVYLILVGPTAILATLVSMYLIMQVGDPGSLRGSHNETYAPIPLGEDVLGGIAFLFSTGFALLSLNMSWQGRSRIPWRPMGIGLSSMICLVLASYVAWAILSNTLVSARLLAFALCAGVALGLAFYLLKTRDVADTGERISRK